MNLDLSGKRALVSGSTSGIGYAIAKALGELGAGLAAVCIYVALVAVTFVFFLPVLTGEPLSNAEWVRRMWFPSWF